MVKLDSCNGSCNTLDDLPNRICVPNKIENVTLSVFTMIIRINESKTLTNIWHASVNLSLMVEIVIQIKSGITTNVDVSAKTREIMCEKKIIFGISVFLLWKW